VIKGKQRARDICKSFDDMQYRIKIFKAKFISYTTETDNKMATVMHKLQEDINRLSNTRETVSSRFLVLFKGVQDKLPSQGAVSNENGPPLPQNMSAEQTIRELQLKLDDYSRKRREAADTNIAVTKKLEELTQLANDYGVIWNMTEENVMVFERDLSLVAGPPMRVLYDRLSRLPGQCRGLMEALDLYAASLFERVDKRARLKRFVRGSK